MLFRLLYSLYPLNAKFDAYSLTNTWVMKVTIWLFFYFILYPSHQSFKILWKKKYILFKLCIDFFHHIHIPAKFLTYSFTNTWAMKVMKILSFSNFILYIQHQNFKKRMSKIDTVFKLCILVIQCLIRLCAKINIHRGSNTWAVKLITISSFQTFISLFSTRTWTHKIIINSKR